MAEVAFMSAAIVVGCVLIFILDKKSSWPY
jgi:hypothetical protein